jgi:hypothetical protein
MAWLTSYYIYVLTVITTGGLETQLGVYSDRPACEAAADRYSQQQTVKELGLTAECTQRVRTEYPGR